MGLVSLGGELKRRLGGLEPQSPQAHAWLRPCWYNIPLESDPIICHWRLPSVGDVLLKPVYGGAQQQLFVVVLINSL